MKKYIDKPVRLATMFIERSNVMDLQARVLAKKRNRLIARDWQEAERAKKTAGYIMCIQGILARGTKGQVTLLRHAQQHYVLIVT